MADDMVWVGGNFVTNFTADLSVDNDTEFTTQQIGEETQIQIDNSEFDGGKVVLRFTDGSDFNRLTRTMVAALGLIHKRTTNDLPE